MSNINATLQDRKETHGDFVENAKTSQNLKRSIQLGKNYVALDDVQREALHMIASKISRILSGNPNNADSWHDIAGYSTLVENHINNNVLKEEG